MATVRERMISVQERTDECRACRSHISGTGQWTHDCAGDTPTHVALLDAYLADFHANGHVRERADA